MLHQSIGMTVLLNQIVGEAGAWLFPSLMDITDANAPDIIKCWLIALDTIDAYQLMEEVKSHCKDVNTQYTAWVYMTKPLYSLLTSWLFTGTIPTEDLQKRMRTIQKGFQTSMEAPKGSNMHGFAMNFSRRTFPINWPQRLRY